MTSRFEELEEQIKQLETIPLVVSTGAQVHAPEGLSTTASGTEQLASTKTQNSNGAGVQDGGLVAGSNQLKAGSEREAAESGPLARVASVVLNLGERRPKTRLRALENEALAECQERMRQVVGGVIKDAKRQLEGLTNELVPRFQMRLERTIENSVGTLTTQATQQVEPEVRGDTCPGVAVVSISEPEDISQAGREWREGAQGTKVADRLASDGIDNQLAQTFSSVVEEVQLKSAAFLDRLNLQLHSALQAFE